MQTILECDDDKQIVEAINIYLTSEGFNVIKAYDGYEALDLLAANDVNLMIVDVMMPGLDGIRTTLKVRETSSIPIIILSAKSEDTDKILGLNIGADDYISKPFNPLELVARVKSQIRRYTQLGNMGQQNNSQVYKCGGLMINDENKEVTVDGEPIKLTPIEFDILWILCENRGQVISSEKLFEPHVFAWNGGCWYLKGKLLKNDDVSYEEPRIQVLALHRITEAKLLDGHFFPAPEILKAVKEKGLFNFDTLPDVELEFFPPFDLPMFEKYSNSPGAVKERKKDSVVIHLKNLTEYEAAQLVLNACGNAKIHEPEELKVYIRRIANKILDHLNS